MLSFLARKQLGSQKFEGIIGLSKCGGRSLACDPRLLRLLNRTPDGVVDIPDPKVQADHRIVGEYRFRYLADPALGLAFEQREIDELNRQRFPDAVVLIAL
ncbi:hypothetical protein D3C80_1208420 [compost metagenome]